MTGKELQKQLETADIEKVGQYMKMFDRILLCTLAVNTMPKEAILGTINIWEKVIKKTINSDVMSRTEFLESTPEGRRAKYDNEPDGEDLRLHFLKQCDIAKNVIYSNLAQQFEKDSD